MGNLKTMVLLCTLAVLTCSCTLPRHGAGAKAKVERQIVAFTFAGQWNLDTFPEEAIGYLNESVFTGAGITYLDPYSCKNGPTVEDLAERIKFLKTRCKKNIWLVLYLNQMLGFDPNNPEAHPSARGKSKSLSRFTTFRGLDLNNDGGAREIFEANWVEALKIAQALGSPGIMFDTEPYNDSRCYNITGKPGLAELLNLTPEETAKQVRIFGAKLADLTHETYPEATLWFFMFRLTQENDVSRLIALSILERCKEKKYALRIIDGGEDNPGYLHPNAAYLAQMILRRWVLLKPYLSAYPNLEISGVHAPFMEAKSRAYWMDEDAIGALHNVEDMQPLYEELFKNYRYLWVYGAWNAFNPYSPDSERFSKVLRLALAQVDYAPPELAALPAPPDKPLPPPLPIIRGSSLKLKNVATTPGVVTLVDFSEPEKFGINRAFADTWPQTNAVLIVLPSKTDEKYIAELRFGVWKKGEPEWPTVSATNLPVSDFKSFSGVAIDVKNTGKYPGEIGLQVRDDNGKAWWDYYYLRPGEEGTISVSVEAMETDFGRRYTKRQIDASRVKVIEFLTRRPKTDLQFRLGPCVLAPKE